MTVRNLQSVLRPASVALFGASAERGSVGWTVTRNLKSGGFKGPVWFVNPAYEELDGSPCFADAAALPDAPELAVVATPPDTVPDVIAAAGERGARGAVVITAGIGEENSLRERTLAAARAHDMRLIGPNCIGLLAPRIGLNASFAHRAPEAGNLAFLSQSGALIGGVVDWAAPRNIGFSHIVSLGDMADVDVGDLLDFFGSDLASRAILLYLETITDAREFMSAARSAARAKPVVVVKAGRHESGARAAASHTGALAGSNAVYDAAFMRAGVLRVRELEELFDAAETLARIRPFEGSRLAIVTNGGGAGVIAVDDLEDRNGDLAELGEDTLGRLDAALPATWSRANPVDIIGDAPPERYEAALAAVLDDDNVDAVLVVNCPTALASSADAARAVVGVQQERRKAGRAAKPVFAAWLGDDTARSSRAIFDEAGIPLYQNPGDAVRGFMHMVEYSRAQRALMRVPPSLPDGFSTDPDAARAVIDKALAEERTLLSEVEAKTVLSAYGIATVPTEFAREPREARRRAAALFTRGASSVAIKVLSPDITHKTDVGGVRLRLESAAAVEAAASDMLKRLSESAPRARIEGFSVQPMVERRGAYELIAGLSEDAQFGPVVLFGAGGTAVEVIDDKALGLPPLDLLLARQMVERTRIHRLLKGYRDREPADIDGIALTLVRLSHLSAELPEVRELDINPLLADPDGVIALDARIVVAAGGEATEGTNPRFAIRPYPKHLESEATLQDGRTVLVRPIRPQDEALYDRFLEKTSPEDLRMRLFSPVRELSDQFIARLTQIDYARAMAFVAIDPSNGELLGVARLAADPDYENAEYGVIVRSDLKGQGLGWALMTRLIDYARAEGLKELYGDVLRENRNMIAMCRELGFDVAGNPDEPTLVRVSLSLDRLGS